MAAPSSFKAVEDIGLFSRMDIMYGQQKNKQKQNPPKKIEFVFVINEK